MWGKEKNPAQMQKDREALRKLGYIQELDRSMGLFSNFAIAFSVISVLTGINILYGSGIRYGNVACVWTFPIVGLFQFIVALALAEIAAVYPVAGGVYKWTTLFSNNAIGWFCGQISLIGWIACAAGVDYGLAQFLTDFLSMDEVNRVALLTLVGIIIFIHSLLNLYGMKLIRWLCDLSVIVHIVGIVIISALLFVFRPPNTTGVLDFGSIWISGNIWGLLPTLLMSTWALTGFDVSASVSEESMNPSFTVPMGMILSITVSVFFGTLFLLCLGLATTDVNEILTSGQSAVIFVISKVLGPIVSKYVVVIMIIVMFICGLSLHTLIIRKIYALARDSALPRSNIWKLVSSNEVPNYSVLLTGVLTFALCAAAAMLPFDTLPLIASLSILGISASHALTIAVSFSPMIKNWHSLNKRNFFSGAIKAIAVGWQVFICAVMAYYYSFSGIIFAGLMALVILSYFVLVRNNLLYDRIIVLSEEDLIRIENIRNNYREEIHDTK